ncbi:MAG: tetratricopeptide repeat protein [Mediterranea sp.]|jgi:tetratricopeptide (TPR) repeat protein|nr:tetratricopeptide repeat protein [Mediterranea sp.]
MVEHKKANEGMNVGEAVTQSEEFLIKNKKTIVAVIAVIIVVIAGMVMYHNFYAQPREEKAQVALFPGENYFRDGQYEYVLNGDSIGFEGLLKMTDQYSGTKAGKLAKAYIGLSYEQLGKNQEAIDALNSFNGKDLLVAPALQGAIGNCYARLGELDKATSHLLKAATGADSDAISPIFLMQAGQIFETQGKYDDAIKAYTQVKDKYFRSYQAMDIDKYIERATLLKK